MNLRESFRLAFDTLRAHKLRSFLTLLGIIIAVTTLIAVVSVIEGMNNYIADRVANMGSNVFSLDRFGFITSYKEWMAAQKRPRIVMDDYYFIREKMRTARDVAAMSWGGRYDVKSGDKQQLDVQVRASSSSYINMSTEQLDEGRFITDTDFEHRAMVAFIGTDVADVLFPHQTPIGRTVTFRGQDFTVIGVAKKMGTILNQPQDNFVIIPLTTLQKIVGSYRTGISIRIQALGPEYMERAQEEATMLMRARHHLKPNAPDDFGITSPDTIYQLWKNLTGTIAAVAIGVTAVFLVVGGIVVMNIMLASVTERTHEIGIRKSLGARKRDILIQFLVEASALSAAGGLCGVFLAFLGTKLMAALTDIPSSLPLGAAVLAVSISAAIGLFFGIYPASKAAKLDPITALRAE